MLNDEKKDLIRKNLMDIPHHFDKNVRFLLKEVLRKLAGFQLSASITLLLPRVNFVVLSIYMGLAGFWMLLKLIKTSTLILVFLSTSCYMFCCLKILWKYKLLEPTKTCPIGPRCPKWFLQKITINRPCRDISTTPFSKTLTLLFKKYERWRKCSTRNKQFMLLIGRAGLGKVLLSWTYSSTPEHDVSR